LVVSFLGATYSASSDESIGRNLVYWGENPDFEVRDWKNTVHIFSSGFISDIMGSKIFTRARQGEVRSISLGCALSMWPGEIQRGDYETRTERIASNTNRGQD
jgi:hypothetical protein